VSVQRHQDVVHDTNPFKRDIVVSYPEWFGFWLFETKVEQNPGGLIEKFITVHEDDVSALTAIKVLYEESARASGDLSVGYQKQIVEQKFAVGFRTKDRMAYGHAGLR
jgi:hypothetical protein